MSVLSIDSGEDVDLDELTLSVLDEVGSALLPSVDAELVAGVPVDESPTGLVVADGALVWEPLEAAAEELSGVLATGELDGDALVVLDDGAGFVGVVVGVSASRGIVAMGVSTAGFSAEAPGVVDGTVDEGVCGLEVAGDEVTTAPVATGVSAVDPGAVLVVDVGDPTVDSGVTVAIATVDEGVAEDGVDDGGSARMGISEKEPAADGVGAVGVDPVDADGVEGAAVAVGCVDAVGDSVTGENVAVGVPVAGVPVSGVVVGDAVSVVLVPVGAVVGVSARIGTSAGKLPLVGVVVATGAIVAGFAEVVAEGVAVSAGVVVTGAVELDAVGVDVAGVVDVVGEVAGGFVDG
ncbi:hypothetical protein PI124_g18939 [Phytophthora idaei]|nr:hypothetical protein PI124_g18939 [Phytophthora idaei]